MLFLRPSSLRLALFTLVLLALSVPQLASAQPAPTQYTIISVPGPWYTTAFGLNNRGQVVGEAQPVNAAPYGFLYDAGNYTILDASTATSPFPETTALAINDRAQVVGYYIETDPDFGIASYAFVYDRGIYTRFHFPGSPVTFPFAINDRSQVMVLYFDSDFNTRSALYDQGAFLPLSPPDDIGLDTEAYGLNEQGQAVGDYNATDYFTTGLGHGFLYDHGRYSRIDVPGASSTSPHSLNNRGQVVGNYHVGGFGSPSHGFLYDHGVYTLIDYPGAASSEALGISDGGQIAGSYSDSVGTVHGFLYDRGVYTRLDAPGAGTGLYQGTYLEGVNAQGQIAGYFTNFSSGIAQSFLLSR